MAGNFNNIYNTLKNGMNDLISDVWTFDKKRTFLNRVIADTNKYVPYDTGKLSEAVHSDWDLKGITYDMNYASYVYNMPPYPDTNFTRTMHPDANSGWDKLAQAEFEASWRDYLIKLLQEGL